MRATLLFTRNNTVVSRLIRAITGEKVSHVAIDLGDFIVHASFPIITTVSKKDFYKKYEVLYNIEEELVVNPVEYIGRFYDFSALFFAGVLYLLRKLTGKRLYKTNLFNITGLFMCTELAQVSLGEEIDSLETPYQLYLKLRSLKESKNGNFLYQ